MKEQDVLNLTPAKLKARVQDVFEIHAHLEGPKERQGRIVREPRESVQRRVRAKGVRPPTNVKE